MSICLHPFVIQTIFEKFGDIFNIDCDGEKLRTFMIAYGSSHELKNQM